MTDTQNPISDNTARNADRLYGELLIGLAAMSAAAPFFVTAILEWSLFLAGAAGVWWLAFDRTPRGLIAAAGWALITLGLGLHLTFHLLLGVVPLELTLGGGFVLLGASEMLLGVERYRRRPVARGLLVAGGLIAALFGLAFPMVWPSLPTWVSAVTVAVMFATFGAALLVGDARNASARRSADLELSLESSRAPRALHGTGD